MSVSTRKLKEKLVSSMSVLEDNSRNIEQKIIKETPKERNLSQRNGQFIPTWRDDSTQAPVGTGIKAIDAIKRRTDENNILQIEKTKVSNGEFSKMNLETESEGDRLVSALDLLGLDDIFGNKANPGRHKSDHTPVRPYGSVKDTFTPRSNMKTKAIQLSSSLEAQRPNSARVNSKSSNLTKHNETSSSSDNLPRTRECKNGRKQYRQTVRQLKLASMKKIQSEHLAMKSRIQKERKEKERKRTVDAEKKKEELDRKRRESLKEKQRIDALRQQQVQQKQKHIREKVQQRVKEKKARKLAQKLEEENRQSEYKIYKEKLKVKSKQRRRSLPVSKEKAQPKKVNKKKKKVSQKPELFISRQADKNWTSEQAVWEKHWNILESSPIIFSSLNPALDNQNEYLNGSEKTNMMVKSPDMTEKVMKTSEVVSINKNQSKQQVEGSMEYLKNTETQCSKPHIECKTNCKSSGQQCAQNDLYCEKTNATKISLKTKVSDNGEDSNLLSKGSESKHACPEVEDKSLTPENIVIRATSSPQKVNTTSVPSSEVKKNGEGADIEKTPASVPHPDINEEARDERERVTQDMVIPNIEKRSPPSDAKVTKILAKNEKVKPTEANATHVSPRDEIKEDTPTSTELPEKKTPSPSITGNESANEEKSIHENDDIIQVEQSSTSSGGCNMLDECGLNQDYNQDGSSYPSVEEEDKRTDDDRVDTVAYESKVESRPDSSCPSVKEEEKKTDDERVHTIAYESKVESHPENPNTPSQSSDNKNTMESKTDEVSIEECNNKQDKLQDVFDPHLDSLRTKLSEQLNELYSFPSSFYGISPASTTEAVTENDEGHDEVDLMKAEKNSDENINKCSEDVHSSPKLLIEPPVSKSNPGEDLVLNSLRSRLQEQLHSLDSAIGETATMVTSMVTSSSTFDIEFDTEVNLGLSSNDDTSYNFDSMKHNNLENEDGTITGYEISQKIEILHDDTALKDDANVKVEADTLKIEQHNEGKAGDGSMELQKAYEVSATDEAKVEDEVDKNSTTIPETKIADTHGDRKAMYISSSAPSNHETRNEGDNVQQKKRKGTGRRVLWHVKPKLDTAGYVSPTSSKNHKSLSSNHNNSTQYIGHQKVDPISLA